MNKDTSHSASANRRRRGPPQKNKPRNRGAAIVAFNPQLDQPDAVERSLEKASRWYGEYVPPRGWPPEDRPA